MTADPVRWTDPAGEPPPGVREVLATAADDSPAPHQLGALAARLGARSRRPRLPIWLTLAAIVVPAAAVVVVLATRPTAPAAPAAPKETAATPRPVIDASRAAGPTPTPIPTSPAPTATVAITVVTRPAGGTVYVDERYRGPSGVAIPVPAGTTQVATCHLPGHVAGQVELVGKTATTVVCVLKRLARCPGGGKDPFDDCASSKAARDPFSGGRAGPVQDPFAGGSTDGVKDPFADH